MNKSGLLVLCLCMFVLLVVEAEESSTVDCNPVKLMPCIAAIKKGGDPSKECCDNLKQQQPCLCGYLKDPRVKPYLDSPNAKPMAGKCGVAIPTC